MAGQQGFLYEGRVFNKLKSKNLVPAGVKPAGPVSYTHLTLPTNREV